MQPDSSQHWIFRVPKKPVRLVLFFGIPILVLFFTLSFLRTVLECPGKRIEQEILAPLGQTYGVNYVMRYISGHCWARKTELYQVVRFVRGNQVAVKEIFWGYPHVIKWLSDKTLRVCQFGANQFSEQDSFDEPWHDIIISYRLGFETETSFDRDKLCLSP
jgi:hypothetical protein